MSLCGTNSFQCVCEHTVAHEMVKYALKLLKDFSRMTSTRYTIAMMISGL